MIRTTTLPLQRPDFFNNTALNSQPQTPAEREERDRVVQMRKDYNEVDRALKDMYERMAAVKKSDSDRPGHIQVREGHWLGNYGRLFVNSELHFSPESGIPSRFYQHHEGSGDTYSYRNQDGVESLGCFPTAAGTSYVIDHNQNLITISREEFPVRQSSGGGWGGVYAAGTARRESQRLECEIIKETAAAAAVGTLLGAGLGLTAGHLVGALL